jgi:Tol biopolymer transport system component
MQITGKLAGHRRSVERLDRLDWAVSMFMLALLIAIGIVIARGDQVGIRVQSFGPSNVLSSLGSLHIVFDAALDPASAESHFVIDPPVPGRFSVAGDQLTFRPATSFKPGQAYSVTVRAGLAATSGQSLKQDARWQFRVRFPRLVFLGPMNSPIQNLYAVEPAAPGEPQKLIHSEDSIVGYDVLPDGSKIVYSIVIFSEANATGTTSLFVWDASTGKSSLLYECQDAACTNLTWRPDGGAVAFQRVDFNTALDMAPSVPRVWIYDLASNTAQPLFRDSQQIGYMPRWSPDGTRLAVFSVSAGGILIHDFVAGKDSLIPADQGELGDFSPDGKWLYFPKVVALGDGNYAVHLTLVNLTTEPYTSQDLERPDEPVSDMEAAWRRDSKGLIVARQPATRKLTEGPQLYNIDLQTGRAAPLVPDDGYNQDNLGLSPAGDELVFQRVALDEAVARPEVWMYNLTTHEIKRLAENGTIPRWMP